VQIMRIRLLHRRGGVVRGQHGFCDDPSQQFEIVCASGIACGSGKGLGCMISHLSRPPFGGRRR
jgi:hypothetical protein